LGDGLTSGAPANNEALDQKSYLNGGGGKTTNVIGFQLIYTFSGDRIPGDAAQDYIAGKQFALGAARKTSLRVTLEDGSTISGPVTIANIAPGGGDAAAVKSFGFELHFNGKPALAGVSAAPALTATLAAGTAVGTTKATAVAAVGNKLGYTLTAEAVTANARQYVGEVIDYTSGADIKATAGQFLTVYELDKFDHLVKFVSEALDSADIKA